MKKLLALAVFGVSQLALASISPTGEPYGYIPAPWPHGEIAECWAKTTCSDGREISCTSSGTGSCRWQVSIGEYVYCEATESTGVFTWTRQSCQ